jgi:hypothetical protein
MAKLEKQSVKAPPGQIKHDDHSITTLDPSSYDTKGTPTTTDDEMYFGDGNLPTNYNISVDSKTHIELGLKIHYRQGNDITPDSVDADGTAHYTVPDGTQVVDPAHGVSSANTARAAWNFDFSVNTGLDGSTKTLDNFDFRIRIADDDGNVQVFDLQHVSPGVTPWVNVTTGAGATLGALSGDNEDGLNPQLSQDSVNMGFGFLQAAFGPDALSAGEHYDILLQAFDHGKIVAQVHDVLVLA